MADRLDVEVDDVGDARRYVGGVYSCDFGRGISRGEEEDFVGE